MKQIMIHQSVGWTAYEAKHKKPNPKPSEDKTYIYHPGKVLDVVPNLGPDDEYVEGTCPEGRAEGLCKRDIASEYTEEAITETTKRREKRRERIERARAQMDEE